jgi:hypothetical protein
MKRQEREERVNRQTSRLTLLEKKMACTHHRHLKDYTQQKPNAAKEKQEATMISMEKISGCGKWRSMVHTAFLVKQLRPALNEHVAHHLKECVYTIKSLACIMDLKHGINLSGIDALHQIERISSKLIIYPSLDVNSKGNGRTNIASSLPNLVVKL